jgi:hypothetical protein
MDAQVLTELAIKAMRQNKVEDAIRAMQMAYTVYRLATGEIEGIDDTKANHRSVAAKAEGLRGSDINLRG